MLAHSQGFKNSINGFGRELDVKITYYGNNGYLATQDNKLVLTEDNMKILMEENQSGKVRLQIDSDDLYKVDKNNLGELFRTYMKSFDIETTTDLDIGSIVNVEIGCKVDDEYEYLNYGHYIVYTKNYNEDTKTYEYQLCDYMLKTMIPFDAWQVFEANENKLGVAIRDICDYCGLPRPDTTDIPNGDEFVYRKTFEGYNLTCRDVLDMLLQASGVSLRMNDETPTLIDWHTQVVDTINEDNLKNKNVKFVNKFGPINSLVFSRGDGTDNLAKKDQESIDDYGETQYFIQNNLILDQDNREDFLFELFYQIKGLEYYECDIDLIGLEYIEYMDRFNVQIGDNTYNCLCLKNTSSIKNGLTENLKSEEPKEKKQEYVKEALSDKDASIVVDKIKGTIVLKTDSDGKLAQVRLDSSGDEGSLVQINADSIDFSSHTFNLDTDDITIESDKIDINKDGIFIDGSGYQSRFELYDENNNYTLRLFAGTIGIQSGKGTQFSITETANSSSTPPTDWYDYEIMLKSSLNNRTYVAGEGITTPELTATDIYYRNLHPQSLEEIKKDFEELPSGLDIIKDIDIYKYRYKEEEDTKKHIGLVIGKDYNYSKEITNDKNDGVDLYSFISVCCKAIQEQQQQIEELKEEIQKLREDK